MLVLEFEDGGAGASHPLDVVCGDAFEPGVPVFGDDDGEEVGYGIVVVGPG